MFSPIICTQLNYNTMYVKSKSKWHEIKENGLLLLLSSIQRIWIRIHYYETTPPLVTPSLRNDFLISETTYLETKNDDDIQFYSTWPFLLWLSMRHLLLRGWLRRRWRRQDDLFRSLFRYFYHVNVGLCHSIFHLETSTV